MGSLRNSGQVCSNKTRIVVSRRRQEELLDALSAMMRMMPVGDPNDPATQIGPMVSSRQRDRVESYIASGKQQGARLVMPFAWLELAVVGAALLVHARHATDRERILLQGGVLTVERECGSRTERCEFRTEWVRVGSAHRGDSLIELSERGKKVVVGRGV